MNRKRRRRSGRGRQVKMAEKTPEVANEGDSSSEEDDDEDDEDEEEQIPRRRTRRDTADSAGGPAWCTGGWNPVGNPNYGRRMRLWSKSRFHLGVRPNGRVIGVQLDDDPLCELELESVPKSVGEVRIRGLRTDLYIAMNEKGRLYGEKQRESPRTVWVEDFYASYNVYLSKHWAHLGWYLALKKDGKPKNGKRTKLGQKATQFLPIRLG